MRTPICFGTESHKFLYRVAGVATIDGRVLVHSWEGGGGLFCLPGGRVSVGESGGEAIGREMSEELGCEAKIGRLLWVIENMFAERDVMRHEIGLYFEIELPEGLPPTSGEPWTGHEEDGSEMYFRWHPIDKLSELKLVPSCLPELLRKLPEHTQYLLHHDT